MKFWTHRKLHKSGNVMMRLASMLFVLVLVSTCMLAGLLARYTVTSSGADGARVAGFSVNAVNDAENSSHLLDFGAAEPLAIYAIDFQNKSETAVRYSVILRLSEALPAGIEVELSDTKDSTSKTSTSEISEDKKTYIFTEAGQMAPASETVKYLKFSPKAEAYGELGDGFNYQNEREFEIEVEFVQID